MAFNSHMWLFIFRTPADDYKHLHLVPINGIPLEDDPVKWFYKVTNIDAKIVRAGPIKSADEIHKWNMEIQAKGGSEYRSLRPKEQHLTLADMANLKQGKPLDFLGLNDEPTPVSLTLQELQAKAAELSKKPEPIVSA